MVIRIQISELILNLNEAEITINTLITYDKMPRRMSVVI